LFILIWIIVQVRARKSPGVSGLFHVQLLLEYLFLRVLLVARFVLKVAGA
jgi:hypothetical protein